MDIQLFIALGIVGLCGAYVLRLWIRRWTGKSAGGCGSCALKQYKSTSCGSICASGGTRGEAHHTNPSQHALPQERVELGPDSH